MNKQERKTVEKLLSCLDGRITGIPASKQELLDELAKSSSFNVCFHDSQMTWDKHRVMTEIKLLSDPCWQGLLTRLQEQFQRRAREDQLAEELIGKLEARFPDEDFDLAELVRYDRRCYGIKIYMCGQGYLFDYDGTIEQLTAELIREVEDRLKETVRCPFCGAEKPRHHWYDVTECLCGAKVVRETSKRYVGRGKYVSELAQAMRKNRNAVSVGKGSTNWEMWFEKDQ
jgi:hypothetical protein